jgi:hypothetical protein
MSGQPYGATTSPARGSRAGAIALIIIGSVVALIAMGLLAAGGVLCGRIGRNAMPPAT